MRKFAFFLNCSFNQMQNRRNILGFVLKFALKTNVFRKYSVCFERDFGESLIIFLINAEKLLNQLIY